MQYLPGVLKLQKYLFDRFHQQIGQEKALSETIGAYKKTLQKGDTSTNAQVQSLDIHVLLKLPYSWNVWQQENLVNYP